MRIVIVEDEPRARRGLRGVIESLGAKHTVVGEAPDGKQGAALIRELQPDVAFVDIRMPVMDGLQMMESLQTEKLNTQFVVVSALEEFGFAKRAISYGVAEYLVKPICRDDVQLTLQKLDAARSAHQGGGILARRYPNAHLLVLRALEMIEKEYDGRISSEEYANRLCITKEYFSTIFRRDIGETFPRFVNQYRMEVAETLLKRGDISPKDVPYMVGFSDSKYFNKQFLEITGESVSAFLRRELVEKGS